jgi:hypothetical protein
MNKRCRFGLCLALAMLMSVNVAHAWSICWVADVRNRGDGVEVLFGNSFVNVWSGGRHYKWSESKLTRLSMNESTMLEGGLHLKLGETASMNKGGHHSSCRLEVIQKDGKLAIKLESLDNLPGMPPQSAVEVVVAR